jgi:uncharacterized protein (TIGR02118 family)
MGLLQKTTGLSSLAFRKYWRDVHGPLAAKLPGLRRYHQNNVVDRQQRAIDYPRGAYEFDGIAELWFDDLPSMNQAFASEEGQKLSADEPNFIGSLATLTGIQHVVIPDASEFQLIKRMSTLRRRPDVSPELFKSEWFDTHSVLVKRLPQVKGYTQNLVFNRTQGHQPVLYERLSIDGIVELWFEDIKSLNAGFESAAGTTLMTHAKEFISEISTFLVEVERVI